MKRLLVVALALLVGAVAVPAFADVTVTATIDKDKDITVTETITKVKDPRVQVLLNLALPGAAEAAAVSNISNTGNTVSQTKAGGASIDLDAVLTGSVLTNKGVVQLNQDVGNMVNQGNLLAVAGTGSNSWVEGQADVDQVNSNNNVTADGRFNAANPDRRADINGSINANQGVVGVNQNAGNMNNQTSAVAAAIGLGGRLALSEAALGQVNSGNVVAETTTLKTDSLAGSVLTNSGIVTVNQSAGNMNNQGVAISASALTARASIQTFP
jgi:hypothetical protein